MAGLLLTTWVTVAASRRCDAGSYLRLLGIGKSMATGAFVVLLALDVASALIADAATPVAGLYMFGLIGWVFLVIVPLGLRTQRKRLASGWSRSWRASEFRVSPELRCPGSSDCDSDEIVSQEHGVRRGSRS
ncbi:MAG TPA: hypothetical protein VLQ52_01385 [Coriobacteriia bacterium]|nr:hypothetical protein [Coriobacteriia bacterium]